MKVVDIFKPFGGMSQTLDLMLFGIHSTKYEEFLFCTLSICSSTSLVDMRPRNMQHAVKVTSVTWVRSAHHVLSIELLLGQFWHSQCTVLLGTTGGQWSETDHEEVQTWEWDHVYSDLAQVTVQADLGNVGSR